MDRLRNTVIYRILFAWVKTQRSEIIPDKTRQIIEQAEWIILPQAVELVCADMV